MTDTFSLQKGNRGAAINTNKEAYGSYWKQRQVAAETLVQKDEINNIKQQINQIQQDQNQIKDLLIKLLEKNNDNNS